MISRITERIFLSAAQCRALQKGMGIFCYHGIGASPGRSPDPHLFVSTEEFDRQLEALNAADIPDFSLDDFTPEIPVRRGAVLTFDDGLSSVHDQALGTLERHHRRALLFIVSERIGSFNEWDASHGHARIPLMNETQIREWLSQGHHIGSHSLTHRNLGKISGSALRSQVEDSKKQLEDRFGIPVRHFAYPHGRWNESARAVVAAAGYATASTTDFGVNGPECDPFALRRIVPLSGRSLVWKAARRLFRFRC